MSEINGATDIKTTGELQTELSVFQQRIKHEGLPVIIVFEGWGASGKGNVISGIIRELDPRGYKVYTTGERSDDERRYPPMRRFWTKLPEYGNIAIFDRSWYRDVSISAVEDGLSEKTVRERTDNITEFERQLVDDGYLILKFFLDISSKEQKKRFEELERRRSTEWRVTPDDWRHHRMYDAYRKAFDEMIERTDNPRTPWYVIDAGDRKETVRAVLRKIKDALEDRLGSPESGAEPSVAAEPYENELLPLLRLEDTDLSVKTPDDRYKSELKSLRERLFELQSELYRKKRPLIIAFEGWDAAGKGGAIKRLVSGLDPRGYEVIPVCAPTREELHRQFLWRFWRALPRSGHIAIFDRSWYGRVMVERIEGFCTETRWKQAYREMNAFERELSRDGAILLKLWLHISPEEQLARFNERLENPEKNWKITDEDWRNREKWSQYEQAVNDMLRLTNTRFAPWEVIAGNDKKFARLEVLRRVIARIEDEL